MNHLNEKISHAVNAYGFWYHGQLTEHDKGELDYGHRYINAIFNSIQHSCDNYNNKYDMKYDLKYSPNLKVILDIPYYERMNIPKDKLTIFNEENTYIKFNGNKYPLPDSLTKKINHVIGSKYILPKKMNLKSLKFTNTRYRNYEEPRLDNRNACNTMIFYNLKYSMPAEDYTNWNDVSNLGEEEMCKEFLGYCLEHSLGFAALRSNNESCATFEGFKERIEGIEKQIEEENAYPGIRKLSNEERMAYLIKNDKRLAEYLPEELKQVYKEFGTDFPAHLDGLRDKIPTQETQNKTEPSKEVFKKIADDKNVAESVTDKGINIASSKPKTIDELINVAKNMSDNDKKRTDGQGNDDMKSDRKSDSDGPGGL